MMKCQKVQEVTEIFRSDNMSLSNVSNIEYKTYLKAVAVRDFTKEKLRDSQSALSARQSILSFETKTNMGYANDKRIT